MIGIDELLKEERINIANKDRFQIWGGEINLKEAVEFINSWDLSGMPYIIIETFGEIVIKKTSVPVTFNPELTKRIRIFGDSGDIELRNDSSLIKWRYIGQVEPSADIRTRAKDFWKEHNTKKFFVEEREALLWGRYKGKSTDESEQERDFWYHPRVATAKLFYPVDGNPEQIKICYKTLSENGCISFVWYTGLKGGTDNE